MRSTNSRWARRALALFVAASAIVPLASCGGSDVHDVYTALDEVGNRKRTKFYTDTLQIFCDVEYSSGRPDVTVKAIIKQLDPKSDAPIRTIAQSEEAPGQTQRQILSFQLQKLSPTGEPDTTGSIPWPTGVFECQISENGTIQKTTQFTIVAPECPDGFAVRGQPCQFFYAAPYEDIGNGIDGKACPDDRGQALCCDPDPSKGWVDPLVVNGMVQPCTKLGTGS